MWPQAILTSCLQSIYFNVLCDAVCKHCHYRTDWAGKSFFSTSISYVTCKYSTTSYRPSQSGRPFLLKWMFWNRGNLLERWKYLNMLMFGQRQRYIQVPASFNHKTLQSSARCLKINTVMSVGDGGSILSLKCILPKEKSSV